MLRNHIKKLLTLGLSSFFVFSSTSVYAVPPKLDTSTYQEKGQEVVAIVEGYTYKRSSNPSVSGHCLWNILRNHMALIPERDQILQEVAEAVNIEFNSYVDHFKLNDLFNKLNEKGYNVGYTLVNIDLAHPENAVEQKGVSVIGGPILKIGLFGSYQFEDRTDSRVDGHYVEAINSDTLNTQISRLERSLDIRTKSSSVAGSYINTTAIPLSDEEKKERILRNYPPNLSEIQEIGFGVKIKDMSGELVEQRVRPDVHFKGDDGKEYLVFYNNHISQLKDLIFSKLEEEISTNKMALYPMKSNLLQKANEAKDLHTKRLPFNWGDLGMLFVPFYSYAHVLEMATFKLPSPLPVVERAKQLAVTCSNLNHYRKKFGDKITPDSLCAAVVDRSLNQFITLRETPDDRYKAVEEGLYKIMNSDLSDREATLALNTRLDEFKRRINPRASDQQTIDFCFPLNRTSYYLARLERDLQYKDLPTLEVMYELRKKINRLSLEYRFMFIENMSPILGIRIDKCKIIVETEKMTMIFLDRNETQKFQRALEEELDRNASNITGKFDFKPLTGIELRNLANEIKPESYQGMLDMMDRKIIDMEAEKENEKSRAAASCAKVAIKAVDKGFQLALTGDVPMPSSNTPPQITEQDMKEYVAVEKAIKDTAVKEEIDPKEHLLQSTFDNPKNITVNDVPTIIPSPETKIDTGFPTKTTIVKKPENPTTVGKIIKDFNLKPSDVDDLLKSFEHFIESNRIEGQIKLMKNQREYIQKIKENEERFINLFKLYIQMVRCNFLNRTDFGGALITEDREYEMRNVTVDGKVQKRNVTMREYIVREIQRLEDFI